jgi:transcriptional regulator with XRE-family HTH domain
MPKRQLALHARTVRSRHGFGQVVRELREQAELSQEPPGFLAKLSRVYVGEIERGEKTPWMP